MPLRTCMECFVTRPKSKRMLAEDGIDTLRYEKRCQKRGAVRTRLHENET